MATLMAPNERNILLLTGVGHFTTHFFELMFPTLAVVLALQTRVPLADVLGWSFAGYLLFGLGALPAGWLGDRLGARLLLIVGLFGLGVASLAASEAPNGRVLSISLAAMGACASTFHPLGRNLISRTIAERGRARRIHDVFGNAALALTPLIVAVLCARVGWQASYRLVGYALCAVAVACAFLRIDDRDQADPAPPPPPQPVSAARRPLVLLFAAAVLAGITYRGFTMAVPPQWDYKGGS
jgi:MFS family permease